MPNTDKPIRVQRKRTKGYRLPQNTRSVTRPGIWGNPFHAEEEADKLIGDYSQKKRAELGRQMAVRKFRDAMMADDLSRVALSLDARIRFTVMRDKIGELRGLKLACFCSLDGPCHAEVLLELANK